MGKREDEEYIRGMVPGAVTGKYYKCNFSLSKRGLAPKIWSCIFLSSLRMDLKTVGFFLYLSPRKNF